MDRRQDVLNKEEHTISSGQRVYTTQFAGFEARKTEVLRELSSGELDKSPKGSVDAPVVALVDLINTHPAFFTTSSCSGRISVFGNPGGLGEKHKKGAGQWLFVTHELATQEQLDQALIPERYMECGEVTLYFEPFILSLECRTLAESEAITKVAREAGFRESGITSVSKRFMVSVRSSLRMEVPIALEGELLVDHPYLCKLLEIANNKFRVNAERIARFENLLKAFLERTRDDEPPVMQPSSQSDSPCSESQPHGLPGVKTNPSVPRTNPGVFGSSPSATMAHGARGQEPGNWILLVHKRNAKECKDALKSSMWLDFRRKVLDLEGKVAFPVTESGGNALLASISSTTASTVPSTINDTTTTTTTNNNKNNSLGEGADSATAEISNVPLDPRGQPGAGSDAAGPGKGLALPSSKAHSKSQLRKNRKSQRAGSLRPSEESVGQIPECLLAALAQSDNALRRVLVGDAEHGARMPNVTPYERLLSAVRTVLQTAMDSGQMEASVPMEELLAEVPRKWEKLGDAVLLPRGSFAHGAYALPSVALALWPTVARALHAELVAKQDEIKQNGMRQSQVRLLWGREDGWVEHWEGGVVYGLDITRVMFSSGNVTEKARMGSLECKGEVVVDWYAGIGYYTIPLLVKAQAQHVFACEWNPDSVKALNFNLQANGVGNKCTVLQGDNRTVTLENIAHRCVLGLLPSARDAWPLAVRALKTDGGVLHIHHNIPEKQIQEFAKECAKTIKNVSESLGRAWRVEVKHVERVKWYAPHVRHVVVDISCVMDSPASSGSASGLGSWRPPLTRNLSGGLRSVGRRASVLAARSNSSGSPLRPITQGEIPLASADAATRRVSESANVGRGRLARATFEPPCGSGVGRGQEGADKSLMLRSRSNSRKSLGGASRLSRVSSSQSSDIDRLWDLDHEEDDDDSLRPFVATPFSMDEDQCHELENEHPDSTPVLSRAKTESINTEHGRSGLAVTSEIRRNTFETPHRAHNPPPDLFHRPRFVGPAVDSDELRRASLIKNVAPLSIPSSSGLRQTYSGSPMDTPGSSIWSSGSDPVTPLLPLSPSVPFWMTAAGQHIQRLKRESEESKQSSDSMLLMPLVGARDTENGANASSLENNPEVEQSVPDEPSNMSQGLPSFEDLPGQVPEDVVINAGFWEGGNTYQPLVSGAASRRGMRCSQISLVSTLPDSRCSFSGHLDLEPDHTGGYARPLWNDRHELFSSDDDVQTCLPSYGSSTTLDSWGHPGMVVPAVTDDEDESETHGFGPLFDPQASPSHRVSLESARSELRSRSPDKAPSADDTVQPKQVAVGSARSTWTMDALGVLGAMGAAGLAVCARRPRTWVGYGAGVAQDKGSWSGGVVSAVALVAAAGLAAPVLQRWYNARTSRGVQDTEGPGSEKRWDRDSLTEAMNFIDNAHRSGDEKRPPPTGALGDWLPVVRVDTQQQDGTLLKKKELRNLVQNSETPMVLTGPPGWIGQAAIPGHWNKEYLKAQVGHMKISVHASNSRQLNFVSRNFVFRVISMNELLEAAWRDSAEEPDILGFNNDIPETPRSGGRLQSFGSDLSCEMPSTTKEHLYFRAIGANPRKERANFARNFPELAKDINIPPIFDSEAFHSSVLRVGTPGIHLWCHFDVMANVLMQFVGHKRVLLFPPSQDENLYITKSSSEVMNWDEVDYERFPKLRNVTGAMEVILSPNEALYIPPLWFHAVQGIGAGNMSVNVFWRSLDKADCDPKDLYGNKDPPAAAQASMLAAQITAQLARLPEPHCSFYRRRVLRDIQAELEVHQQATRASSSTWWTQRAAPSYDDLQSLG